MGRPLFRASTVRPGWFRSFSTCRAQPVLVLRQLEHGQAMALGSGSRRDHGRAAAFLYSAATVSHQWTLSRIESAWASGGPSSLVPKGPISRISHFDASQE